MTGQCAAYQSGMGHLAPFSILLRRIAVTILTYALLSGIASAIASSDPNDLTFSCNGLLLLLCQRKGSVGDNSTTVLVVVVLNTLLQCISFEGLCLALRAAW